MKAREQLHQELRQRILALSGVTERPHAGIHEDAFFVGGRMFMHIHGCSHCDICLPTDVQRQVLAEGKALQHKWAPDKGYVTSIVRSEETLETTMELIRISHHYFLAGTKSSEPNAQARSNVNR
jgi:hypothetical protein